MNVIHDQDSWPTVHMMPPQVDNQVVETVFEDMISGNATSIDLSLIYPTSTKSVFTYEGSLTTPGCEEHVFWQVGEKGVKSLAVNCSQF